ncbi:MAG: DUF3179 domain-containing protein [Pseudomonadota bacterium]
MFDQPSRTLSRRAALLGGAALACVPALGLAQSRVPRGWARAWPNTDFTSASVPLNEIMSGGVGRDGIPALDGAAYAPASQDDGIPGQEPVLTVALEGAEEHAYPIRYLTWHEIVNDTIAGIPVAITYCPLCNSALVFDRRVDGQVLTFGVSGNLRHSDMIMYDRETESWWQQFTGEAIVGTLVGAVLRTEVSWMESRDQFAARNPQGPVMAQPNYPRTYGRNPYRGYDTSSNPFLYRGENPPHGIEPLMRVVRVGNRAWPMTRFENTTVIEEAGVRLNWEGTMASPLDRDAIWDGRDIGMIRVQDPKTGEDLVHEVVFAFAFHAFAPDGKWMLGN